MAEQRRRGYPCGGGDGEEEEKGDGGDPAVRCTGKSCQSCTAGAIADCVALGCCPCAVVNLLTLVLLKVPWMVGRRLARRRKNKKRRKCVHYEAAAAAAQEVAGEPRRFKVDHEGAMEMSFAFGVEEEKMMEGFEADNVNNVWLEFHPIGHLSFGRVSFTGIQIPSSGEEQQQLRNLDLQWR